MSTARSHAEYQVGDWVKLNFGWRKVTGTITEVRGPLGIHGRQIYQVSVPMDPFEPMLMELPEDELEIIPPEARVSPKIETDRRIEYLTNGGLISILRPNYSEVRNHSRAWLCLDNLGNVTHTFNSERGVVGGQPIPYQVLRDEKVLTSKRDSVVEFVEGFGLSHHEAEEVVSGLGTTR